MNSTEESEVRRNLYRSEFDPTEYHKAFYSFLHAQLRVVLNSYYQAFCKFLGNCKNKKKLLDFGCGPTPIYVGAAMAAGIPLEIVLSEILPQNRDALAKWISKEDGALDYSILFNELATKSGKGASQIESMTRQSIVRVESNDLLQDLSTNQQKYDVVISSYCIECAATSKEEYKLFFEKLVRFLDRGGFLMMAGASQLSCYTVGRASFEQFVLEESYLKNVIQEIGLSLLEYKEEWLTTQEGDKGEPICTFFLVAKRD